jgi:hypothetical protein
MTEPEGDVVHYLSTLLPGQDIDAWTMHFAGVLNTVVLQTPVSELSRSGLESHG